MSDLPMTPSDPLSSSTQDDLTADRVELVGASVVGVAVARRGLAAAVTWKPGLLVTTASAVGRADRVHVVAADGVATEAKVRGRDAATDLALIDFDTKAMPLPNRRTTPPLRAGDAVMAVGRESSGLVQASFGRIGAAGPAWRTWRGAEVEQWLRLDGGLYPGLAGAALADAMGRVIGVASPALSRHHGIVLPWATIDRIGEVLLHHGHVPRGYLGIAAQPVALPRQPGASSTAGLLVAGMADDSPATRAGLLVGDIIVAAGGEPVANIEALRERLSAQPAGTRLALQLSRGGQPLELGVELGQRPARSCH
jgi:S1-C subfamily serine protease